MKKHSIEVDEEVFEALQELATPLVDTPNSVLRRLLLEGRAMRDFGISTAASRLHEFPSRSIAIGSEPRLMRDADWPDPEVARSTPPASTGEPAPGPYASLGHERRAAGGMSPRRLGKLLCARAFPGEMFERAGRQRGTFRTMFESDERLLYFLNFNKPGATNLWYKVTSTALRALLEAKKPASLVFTNPAERLAWVIPIEDLETKYRQVAGAPLGDGDVDLNVDVKGDRLRELDWDIGRYRWAV